MCELSLQKSLPQEHSNLLPIAVELGIGLFLGVHSVDM